MGTNKVILVGGGQHARVVLDCLLSQGADVVALFDSRYNDHLFGIAQRGDYDPAVEPDASAIVAVGDNLTRKNIAFNTKHRFTNTIHASSVISQYATFGVGNMILHGAIVQAQATVGDHVIINTGARVDHDCVIGNFVHVAPGAVLCGNVQVGEGALIGAGATVIPGKKIGAWATVGAGAVVIENIPDYGVAVGNPARVIKYNTP